MGSKHQSALSPRLVVIEGKEKGKVIPLSDGTAVIGRSKGDVLIQDPRISRSHVAVHFDSRVGKLSFTDLKSLNGTVVNGENTESGELSDGDKLQIGNTLFDIQLTRPDDVTSEASLREKAARKLKDDSSLNEPSVKEKLYLDPAPPSEPGEQVREPASATPVTTEPLLALPGRRLVALPSLKISPRTRTILACIIVIGAGVWYLGAGGGGGGEPPERTLASITQLASDGKLEEAQARAEEMRKRHPESSFSHMALGNVYLAANKNDLALASYEKAHGLKPEQQVVHMKLIRVYLRLGRKPDAQREHEHMMAAMASGIGDQAALYIEAANLFMEVKEGGPKPEVILITAKALQKQFAPQSPIGYRLEAHLHLQENRAQDALTAMEAGRKLDPQDEWLLENMMFTKLALKDQAGAEQLLDEWTRIKPTATKPLLVVGYLRYNEKSYSKALPYVQKVLQIAAGNPEDPQYPEALDLMGKIYVAMNQPSEAANFFKQACETGFSQSCENPLIKNGSQPASIEGSTDAAPEAGSPPGATDPAVTTPGAPGVPESRAPGTAGTPATAASAVQPPPATLEPQVSYGEAEAPTAESDYAIPETPSSDE